MYVFPPTHTFCFRVFMAYFGNSDFTGLVADDFNLKKKDKSSSSTDVSGNKRKGTEVERARVRLQERGDKTTKLFHTMGDMVSSDIPFAGFKREEQTMTSRYTVRGPTARTTTSRCTSRSPWIP